jgi:hypothetical protein
MSDSDIRVLARSRISLRSCRLLARPLCDVKFHARALLEITENTKEILGLRITTRTEHPDEILGLDPGGFAELLKIRRSP